MMKVVEMNLAAARKRKSKITGFVHHCYEDEKSQESIAVYENFCYVLALLRSRIAENVLEGRALLEKLLAFKVEDNFPVYLHEYPKCKDPTLAQRLQPIMDAIAGKELPPMTSDQVWHPKFHAAVGEGQYEKGEPAVTLFDLQMGQRYNSFSKRALADHPIHLRAACIPQEEAINVTNEDSHALLIDDHSVRLWWGDEKTTHSFVLFSKEKIVQDGNDVLLTLHDDEIPLKCFCNIHEDNALFIGGQKGTIFHLGDSIEIRSKNLNITLIFTLESGEGSFIGAFSRSNRPHHKDLTIFDGFDWQIALRTVKSAPSTIRLKIVMSTE